MRGGRGGKGGKGGKGGRGSITQDLLRDNYEDLGIENPYSISRDTAPPPLYPPISLRAPCTLREKDIYYIRKLREIKQRVQASPYYLTHKNSEKDIERYTDKYRRGEAKDLNLLSCINASSEDDVSRYIPLELLGNSSLGKRDSNTVIDGATGGDNLSNLQRKRRQDIDLQKLEQQESAGVKIVKKEDNESDGEGDGEEEEEENDDDYGVDHYATDDEFGGSDDGDGEAVY